MRAWTIAWTAICSTRPARGVMHGADGIVRTAIGAARALLVVAPMLVLAVSAAPARADCVCRCVDGQMQPLCSNSIDIPPVCMPTVCGIAPPSIAPIDMPKIPPIGTSQCSQRQVQNPATGGYEWRRVCE